MLWVDSSSEQQIATTNMVITLAHSTDDRVLRTFKTRARSRGYLLRDRRRVEAGTACGLMVQGSWQLLGGGQAIR